MKLTHFLAKLNNIPVTIELKNGTVLQGLSQGCDSSMNYLLKEVKMKQKRMPEVALSFLTVRGPNIRMIILPDDLELDKYLIDQTPVDKPEGSGRRGRGAGRGFGRPYPRKGKKGKGKKGDFGKGGKIGVEGRKGGWIRDGISYAKPVSTGIDNPRHLEGGVSGTASGNDWNARDDRDRRGSTASSGSGKWGSGGDWGKGGGGKGKWGSSGW